MPNDHGVYLESEWTEHIQRTTPSGARVAVMLVQRDDGWRHGVEYSGEWLGGGDLPSVRDAPIATKQDAIDIACARLRRAFGSPFFHDMSGAERRQAAEVHAWCDAQRQLELFA